jgi:hypothetical protein
MLFQAARPSLLNGIENVISRTDLADRGIFLTLAPIGEQQRTLRPSFGGSSRSRDRASWARCLTQVVRGLQGLQAVHLTALPRMANFALWATACGTALSPAGTLRSKGAVEVVEADPVAICVRKLMVERSSWAGTASDLLRAASNLAGDDVSKRGAGWPNISPLDRTDRTEGDCIDIFSIHRIEHL